METFETITVTQIFIGSIIMLLSTALALGIRKNVTEDLRAKWCVIISLMVFFFFGYLTLIIVISLNLPFPTELITGTIFLLTACYAFLVIRLTHSSISKMNSKDIEKEKLLSNLENQTKELIDTNRQLEEEIAKHVKVARELRSSEEKYRSLVDSTEDSIYLVDRDYKYIYINKNHQIRMGFSEEDQFRQHTYGEFHSSEETEEFVQEVDIVFKTGKSSRHEHRSERDEKYFIRTFSPIKEPDGKTVAVTVVSKDITDRKKIEEELRILSITDELTGLYNRRGFFTMVEHQMKIANRQKNRMFMLYADLDNLKGINDAFGHREGDLALIATAKILRNNFRESDVIARMGGDEFAAIPAGASGESARMIAERFQKAIDAYNKESSSEAMLSVSYGFAFYDPDSPCSIDELLQQGDRAMYEHKKSE
jgi:diguanylate cyclase (GGDEF)-like protein/PAS domain S-box-containing protein